MLVVTGSLTIDTIHIGKKTHTQPGGSLLYAAAGASRVKTPHCLGMYGSDFDAQMIKTMEKHCKMEGMEMINGRTFRYECSYSGNKRRDIGCDFGIMENVKSFNIPDSYFDADILLLCTEKPHIQHEIIRCFSRNGAIPIIIMDTISHWVEKERDMLDSVIAESDILSISAVEGFQLTNTNNPFRCAEKLADRGPDTIVLKMAENGVFIYDSINNTRQTMPGKPFVTPIDPTGAGDSFNGAFAASLDKKYDMLDACRRGNEIGAEAVQKRGALF